MRQGLYGTLFPPLQHKTYYYVRRLFFTLSYLILSILPFLHPLSCWQDMHKINKIRNFNFVRLILIQQHNALDWFDALWNIVIACLNRFNDLKFTLWTTVVAKSTILLVKIFNLLRSRTILYYCRYRDIKTIEF